METKASPTPPGGVQKVGGLDEHRGGRDEHGEDEHRPRQGGPVPEKHPGHEHRVGHMEAREDVIARVDLVKILVEGPGGDPRAGDRWPDHPRREEDEANGGQGELQEIGQGHPAEPLPGGEEREDHEAERIVEGVSPERLGDERDPFLEGKRQVVDAAAGGLGEMEVQPIVSCAGDEAHGEPGGPPHPRQQQILRKVKQSA
jgi:hypothetical protein